MNFISLKYFFFITFVFLFYWRIPNKYRNIYLILISCIFYAFWNWHFLGLVAISTFVSYFCGNRISHENILIRRKAWLLCGVIINLGLLAYFKYAGFFISNVIVLSNSLGFDFSVKLLHVILPIGISFYIFQSLTYPLDIYNKRMDPCDSIVVFSTYVTFFPKLIAGPIVRAKDFLNQIKEERSFRIEDFQEGCIRILTGVFKKAVIADTLANELVAPVFSNPNVYGSTTLWLAVIGYSMQIYADFSGYSNIAIGTARIFGFRIAENFSFPYLATDFSDFWRRWHITMSTFFRDYLYIPLGGNKCSQSRVYLNLTITMLLCGLWHGAAWTFVLWGGIHGVLLIFNHIVRKAGVLSRTKEGLLSTPISWIITQLCVCLAWIFFRADNFETAASFFSGLLGRNGSDIIDFPWQIWACMFFFIFDHLYGWIIEHKIRLIQNLSSVCRASGYTIMIVIAYHLIPIQKSQFIYFNF